MEKYIEKMGKRLSTKHTQEELKKIKRNYCIVGGVIIALGLIGFFIAFGFYLYNFLNAETDAAFSAWLYAIPAVIVFVVRAVVTRIGDRLLTDKDQRKYINVEEKKMKKAQKKAAKENKKVENEQK